MEHVRSYHLEPKRSGDEVYTECVRSLERCEWNLELEARSLSQGSRISTPWSEFVKCRGRRSVIRSLLSL